MLCHLSAAQRAKLDRRLANYERTTAETFSWEQVKPDLLRE